MVEDKMGCGVDDLTLLEDILLVDIEIVSTVKVLYLFLV